MHEINRYFNKGKERKNEICFQTLKLKNFKIYSKFIL